jgi:hypothetical protein
MISESSAKKILNKIKPPKTKDKKYKIIWLFDVNKAISKLKKFGYVEK